MSAEIKRIDPAAITVGDRLRAVDAAWVEAIAESIKHNGQSTPIQVRRLVNGRWHLVSGAHRLAACQRLGIEVRAEVVDCDDLYARLMEIDENLFRRELNPLDRAVFLAERKALYLEVYPETKNGGHGGRRGTKEKNDKMSFFSETKDGGRDRREEKNDKMSFSKQTAARINMSVRSIERAIRIAQNIPADVHRRLTGTPLAEKQSDLLYLAGLEPSVQRRAVTLVVDGEVRTLRAAVARIQGTAAPESSSDDRAVERMLALWGRSSKVAKGRFIAHLRETGALD